MLKANWLCNDLGMDPISMGATLAAAMELYENGVIRDDQVERPLTFGSAEALIRMTEATAYREGFGDELAEGSKRMGEKFQHPEVFMGSKGQEFPAYDPRGFQGMGVAYATCNRGGLPPAGLDAGPGDQRRDGSAYARRQGAMGGPRTESHDGPRQHGNLPVRRRGRADRSNHSSPAPPPRPVSSSRSTTSSDPASGRGIWNACGTSEPV